MRSGDREGKSPGMTERVSQAAAGAPIVGSVNWYDAATCEVVEGGGGPEVSHIHAVDDPADRGCGPICPFQRAHPGGARRPAARAARQRLGGGRSARPPGDRAGAGLRARTGRLGSLGNPPLPRQRGLDLHPTGGNAHAPLSPATAWRRTGSSVFRDEPTGRLRLAAVCVTPARSAMPCRKYSLVAI